MLLKEILHGTWLSIDSSKLSGFSRQWLSSFIMNGEVKW